MRLRAKMSRGNGHKDTVAAAPAHAKPLEGDAAAAVRQLHAMVREARTRLTAPTIENLDDCRRRLDEAAQAFAKLQAALPSRDPKRDASLSAPLEALRAEIASVAILLDGAAAFHTGWMRLAACMVSGYGADGAPAQPEATRRVLLEI
jgi:hypothetical protein